ncbi:SIS domain-containing protein [Bacteroidota bacterium]
MNENLIKEKLAEASELLRQFINDDNSIAMINQAGDIISEAIKNGNKVIACGNGGSMSDAMHFAAELTGRFHKNRFPLPAMAISDPSHITCVANDYGFEYIFSRFVEANARKGDILFAISTSANSLNILKAAAVAKKKDVIVIGLTSNNGGKLAPYCDIEIRVPGTKFSDRAQELHIKIIHCLVEYIESQIQ